jgi:hypothetical protein
MNTNTYSIVQTVVPTIWPLTGKTTRLYVDVDDTLTRMMLTSCLRVKNKKPLDASKQYGGFASNLLHMISSDTRFCALCEVLRKFSNSAMSNTTYLERL